MSLVTLEDVSREKRDEEIQEEIRSIVRIVEDRRGRKNVEEKRKKKKRKGERRSGTEAEESFCSLLLFWSGLFFF